MSTPPHMKTRIAVRDRTPHRFQIVPLKDAKQQPATPFSNSRKVLKDLTNSKLKPPSEKLITPLNIVKRSPSPTGFRLPTPTRRRSRLPTSSTRTTTPTPRSTATTKVATTPSPQNTFTSRIPSSKLKAFNSRTLDPAILKPRHGVAHSVDISNPRRQHVRSIFPESTCGEPAATPRLRTSPNSATPSKRHAIYTRSLYVGRGDQCSDRATSLRHTTLEGILAANDSLDSIVQVYQDEAHDAGRSFSLGLPTSLSEPTLHDISSHSLGLASPDVPSCQIRVNGASVSLSSLSSVYSQDSWVSGKQESVASSEEKTVHDSGYHPIVWDLLQKLESAERTWLDRS